MAVSIASRSKFSALKVETGESSESEEESNSRSSTPTNSLNSTGNNKKTTAAKKRALLLEKNKSTTLNGGDLAPTASSNTASTSSLPSAASTSTTTTTKSKPKNNSTSQNSSTQKKAATPKVIEESISSSSDEDAAEEPMAPYTEDEDLSEVEPEILTKSISPPTTNINTATKSTTSSITPSRSSSPISTTTPLVPNQTIPAYTGADHDPTKKLKAIIQRTVYGLLMACALVGIILLGHVYVIALVFICQAVVFSELSGLFDAGYSDGSVVVVEEKEGGGRRSREREERRRGRREERDRWSKRISWYFFAATNYFLYGESLIYYFKHILTLRASFLPTTFSFAQHHRLISFGLYLIGFVSFVANLTRAQLRRQFGLFGWIHMSLLLVVVSSHFMVNNILEGLIWFWVPASLVIMNDIAAYVCGMAFGRHQLIKLSPKKTVEGFVGAFFVTIAFGVVWGTLFMRFNYMICPVQDLATNVLSDIQCIPNQTFVWRNFYLPNWMIQSLSLLTTKKIESIPWAPFQLHTIVLAIFASLVAPFGGFFASGFKRAFNIKDFGASIPGHGGVTDRMDCQFLMGLFSYVYYASLIRETHITVASILSTALTALSTEEQLELLAELGRSLASKGIKAVIPW